MPLISSLSASARAFGMLLRSGLNSFFDNFNRTTSGSLGGLWSSLRGTWYANGTAARSDDSASSYAIAVAPDMASNNLTSSADVSGGTGIAFWISDAGSWWAAYPSYDSQTSSTTSCTAGLVTGVSSTSSCCNVINSYQVPVTTCTNYQTGLTSTSSCQCGGISSSTSCTGSQFVTSTSSCPSGCSATPGTSSSYYVVVAALGESCLAGDSPTSCGNCGSCDDPSLMCCATTISGYYCATSSTITYACYTGQVQSSETRYDCYTQNQTVTTTTYYTRLSIVSSVSGNIVSQANTVVASGGSRTNINSMRLQTFGDQITATGFGSTGLTSQVGSPVVVNASSPQKTNKVGIVKAPTSEIQGSTIDNFNSSI